MLGRRGAVIDSRRKVTMKTLIPPRQLIVHRIEHDGFEGVEIGSYTTLEGKQGVVLQQVGTRVVHVYGRKWLSGTSTDRTSK